MQNSLRAAEVMDSTIKLTKPCVQLYLTLESELLFAATRRRPSFASDVPTPLLMQTTAGSAAAEAKLNVDFVPFCD